MFAKVALVAGAMLACVGALLIAWVRFAADTAPTRDQMEVMMTSAVIKRDKAGGDDKCLFPFAVTPSSTSRAFRAVLLGTEDRGFEAHRFGISERGILAAVLSLGRSRGGSSITQQLVKNILFEPSDNRWKRKAFELPWTVLLNGRFTKTEILSAYLNHIPFRHGIYGIEAASIFYFNKNASDLNYFESALLEVMLANPATDYASRNPNVRGRTLTKARTLLASLVRQNILPQSALNDMVVRGHVAMPPLDCGYVRDFVMREAALHDWKPDASTETFRIFLTVDPSRQSIARSTVDEAAGELAKHNASQVALVDIDRTGRIRALQGGVDYQKSQFDRATDSRHSPGSVGKVIVLAEACAQGMTLADPVDDIALPGGRPRNDDDHYYGRTTLGNAFQHSLNAAFFRLAEKLGPKKVAARARLFGLTGPMPEDGGVAVGDFAASPLQMTAAVDTVASGGFYSSPYVIVGITSSLGRIRYWHERRGADREVLSSSCAELIDHAMRQVVTGGTGRRANVEQARGKTGTTNDYRDAWFVGYTGPVVAGIWVGNDKAAARMNHVMGGDLPAELFATYLRRVAWMRSHNRPISFRRAAGAAV